MTHATFVIVRASPHFEPVAVVEDREEAQRLVKELGPPHTIADAPRIRTGQWRVVHTFACRAHVTDAAVTVGTPYRLAGASRLIPSGHTSPDLESVVVDAVASELERAVHGTTTIHLTAFASTADGALELARLRAQTLASPPG